MASGVAGGRYDESLKLWDTWREHQLACKVCETGQYRPRCEKGNELWLAWWNFEV